MYIADSARGVVHRIEVDRQGELGARRVFPHAQRSIPDGMTTDIAGNVWIAFWDSSVARRYRQDGAFLPSMSTPPPVVRLTNSSLRQNLEVAASYREVDSRRTGACRSQEPARSGDG